MMKFAIIHHRHYDTYLYIYRQRQRDRGTENKLNVTFNNFFKKIECNEDFV